MVQYLPNLVCFGLWGLGFLGRRDRRFTMAPTRSAQRHGAPTTRTCLQQRPLPALNEENGATFATNSGPSPFCRSAAVIVCLVHRVSRIECPVLRIVGCSTKHTTHRRAQTGPAWTPDLSLSPRNPRRHQQHHIFFTALRCPPPALSCSVLTATAVASASTSAFFLSLFSVTLTSSETSPPLKPRLLSTHLASIASPLISHLSYLITHLSVLSPHNSHQKSPSFRPARPHDEALPFVIARAGPIRLWRRLRAPP